MSTHLAIVPPDDGVPAPRGPAPEGRNAWGTKQALALRAQMRDSTALRFPWQALRELVGPLLPGHLVLVGGRPKAGKTTLLLNAAIHWLATGHRWVFVGTETEPEALRIKLAAIEANVSVGEAIRSCLPAADEARFQESMADLGTGKYAGQYLLVGLDGVDAFGTHVGELTNLEEQCAAARGMGAGVVIFDYIQRMQTDPQNPWSSLTAVVRELKNIAKRQGVVLLAGAQLKAGGGLLGEHEVPGNDSWYGGSVFQQEADVALQLWRPFRRGVSTEDKNAAKQGERPLLDLLQPNTMGVRVAAHRWLGESNNELRRLKIDADWITDHPGGAA